MLRLPVSSILVEISPPDGADDLAFLETGGDGTTALLRLVNRIVAGPDGAPADWSALPVTDFEVLLLRLREALSGGTITGHLDCPHCRARAEITFRISDYLAAVRPRIPSGVTPSSRPGWWRRAGVEFRLPQVADLAAARAHPRPAAALRRLCIPDEAAPGQAGIEAAITRMAPEVTGPVGGACPGCGAALTALFDIPAYVAAELRRLAARVHTEIHLLAATYGWTEAAILALPSRRRRRYAELVRDTPLPSAA